MIQIDEELYSRLYDYLTDQRYKNLALYHHIIKYENRYDTEYKQRIEHRVSQTNDLLSDLFESKNTKHETTQKTEN